MFELLFLALISGGLAAAATKKKKNPDDINYTTDPVPSPRRAAEPSALKVPKYPTEQVYRVASPTTTSSRLSQRTSNIRRYNQDGTFLLSDQCLEGKDYDVYDESGKSHLSTKSSWRFKYYPSLAARRVAGRTKLSVPKASKCATEQVARVTSTTTRLSERTSSSIRYNRDHGGTTLLLSDQCSEGEDYDDFDESGGGGASFAKSHTTSSKSMKPISLAKGTPNTTYYPSIAARRAALRALKISLKYDNEQVTRVPSPTSSTTSTSTTSSTRCASQRDVESYTSSSTIKSTTRKPVVSYVGEGASNRTSGARKSVSPVSNSSSTAKTTNHFSLSLSLDVSRQKAIMTNA